MNEPWYRKFLSRAPATNLKTARAKAEQGDADAQFLAGLRCCAIEGAEQDFVQAAQWYRKAAEQNHPVAQFNLGLLFARGQGVLQDDAAAVMWTLRAANAGDAGAQHSLGTRCHRASIQSQSTEAIESRIEAYKWFHLAAEQGYRDSASSRERVTHHMTHEDVTEARQRIARFAAVNSTSSAVNSALRR
jgi:TPR repeat protein